MKVRNMYPVCLLMGLLQFGCAASEMSQQRMKVSIQAGINHGGIVENTDLSEIAETVPVNNIDAHSGATATEVDAFTGATTIGVNTGIHINKPLFFGELEGGADYLFSHQVFTYADFQYGYSGKRKIGTSQFMIPLTYNIVLFRNLLPSTDLQLKAGYLAQFNILSVKDNGALPAYKAKPFSGGLTMGISAYPFSFESKAKLGFFVDFYRGSQFYEDFYNQDSFEMPASSFMKAGLKLQFK